MVKKRKTKSIVGIFENYSTYATIINNEDRLFIGLIKNNAYQACLFEVDFKNKTYFIGKHPIRWLNEEGFKQKDQ